MYTVRITHVRVTEFVLDSSLWRYSDEDQIKAIVRNLRVNGTLGDIEEGRADFDYGMECLGVMDEYEEIEVEDISEFIDESCI